MRWYMRCGLGVIQFHLRANQVISPNNTACNIGEIPAKSTETPSWTVVQLNVSRQFVVLRVRTEST